MSSSPWWSSASSSGPAVVVSDRRGRAKVAAVAGLVLLGLVCAAFISPVERAVALPGSAMQEPASLDDLVAKCQGVIAWQTAPVKSVGWLRAGNTHMYPAFPPTSGTFSPVPLPLGFSVVLPDGAGKHALPRSVANLWRGQVVVWFRPDADLSMKTSIRLAAQEGLRPGTFVVAPWPEEAINRWNTTRPVLLTGWGLSQSCGTASSDVMTAFQARVDAAHAPGEGTAMNEPGPAFGVQ